MPKSAAKNDFPQIFLKSGRERSVSVRHPWIFSGAIKSGVSGVEVGDLVAVCSSSGEQLAVGHYCGGSIAIKLISFEQEDVQGEAFWVASLSRARRRREALGLFEDQGTNCFRVVNAEGDELPGLIIDRYDRTFVLQCHTLGMYRCRQQIVGALQIVYKDIIEAVYDKSSAVLTEEDRERLERDGETATDGCLFGSGSSSQVLENGLQFTVDWCHGQKTGFFLDQRTNRALVRSLSSKRRVLNLFCYTGGFSVAALAGGAESVVSVDSSADALELLAQNVQANAPRASHRAERDDCFKFLESCDEMYDLIVVDPPAFVKHRAALNSGVRGYEAVNHLALKRLAPGGILATFSCSQLLSRELFERTIARSVLRTKRSAQISHRLYQASCHPVSLFHPEGEYLKGLVLLLA